MALAQSSDGSMASNALVAAATERLQMYRDLIFGAELMMCAGVPLAGGLQVKIKNMTELLSPVFANSEGYTLEVDGGSIVLEAERYAGFVWGLETFAQLVERVVASDGTATYQIANTPLKLTDSPVFAYRGVMVDTTPNFLPVDTLKRVIDMMSFTKLNVLHLFLAHDDISRYYSDTFTQSKAPADVQIYTKADLKALKEYASKAAVHLLLEINLPFHTGVWKSQFGANLPTCIDKDGVGKTLLNPSPEVYKFEENILRDFEEIVGKDVMHLGGLKMWGEACSKIGAASTNQRFNYISGFLDELHKSKAYEDTMKMYWVDNRTDIWPSNRQADPNVVYHYYGTSGHSTHFAVATPETMKVVVSPIDIFFTTCGYAKFMTDINCKFRSWWNFYNFDPYVYYGEHIKKIGGVEAIAFGDVISKETIDILLWPRAAALAERAWTSKRQKKIHRRMLAWIERVRSRGYRAAPITNDYCADNIAECFGVRD
jgi:hexosaminidase